MNNQVPASDSYPTSDCSSSVNSMQSESDMAWCYANHVVQNGAQQQKPLMNDEEGWFTCSEQSDNDDEHEYLAHEVLTNDFGGDDDDNDDDAKESASNRQRGKFRPRFQRSTSFASTSSANETKERRTTNRKIMSPIKSKEDGTQPPTKSDNEQNRKATQSGCIVLMNEPDQNERRKMRRLALARMKSEELWGSFLESDSEESHLQDKDSLPTTKQSGSPSQKKKFRKKTYKGEYNAPLSPIKMKKHKEPNVRKKSENEAIYSSIQESESERSCSPMYDVEMNDKATAKKNTAAKRRELSKPISPSKSRDQSLTRCQLNQLENKRPKSAPKIRKQSNPIATDSTQRGRSISPTKTTGHANIVTRRDLKPTTERKSNKYEMIPTGSLRQNRSTVEKKSLNDRTNSSIPIQSDHAKQSFNTATITTWSTTSQWLDESDNRQSPYKQKTADGTASDVILPSKEPSSRLDRKGVTLKRAQSFERLENEREKIPGHQINVETSQRNKPAHNCAGKDRSLRHESSFTEKKKAPKKLDESLLSLSRREIVERQETESTIPMCAKQRNAITPPVPHREYSSHSSTSSSSTTSPSPIGVASPSSGSAPSYKNTVEVKHSKSKMKLKKNIQGDANLALDDIMKSRRYRNSNVELQKKANQYLAAVNTNGGKATTKASWW